MTDLASIMNPTSALGKRVMSLPAIAQELGYHPVYVAKLMREGKIRGLKVNSHWYATADEVDKFKAAHTKYKHYTLEEEAELIRQKEQTERSEQKMSNLPTKRESPIPWKNTEVLSEAETKEYLATVGGRRSRQVSVVVRELALSLNGLGRGQSKRFNFDDHETAEYVQGHLRRATELAGWYKEKPPGEWNNWTAWESHTSDGTLNGIEPSLTVTRLPELKESMSVVQKRNKIKKLQEEG